MNQGYTFISRRERCYPMLKARITLTTCDSRLAEALEESLKVEALNPPDPSRGTARVTRDNDIVIIEIEARDESSARALINAFLSLAASLWDSIEGTSGDVQEAS